jgi:ribosomal protein S18 acetylase RimI-like enzyme
LDEPTLEIRRADLARGRDATDLIAVLDSYAADPMGAGAPLPASTKAELVPALRSFPGASVLLARVGPEPVGAAVCLTGFSTFRARALTNVHDLAVVPNWRGRGIGRRLLAAVEDLARGRGHCKITLGVREDNPAAMALYRRGGFGAGQSAGQSVQYLFLEKRLPED